MYDVNNLGWNYDTNRFDNHHQPVDENVTSPVEFIGGWFVALVCEEDAPLVLSRESQDDDTIVYVVTAQTDGRFIGALYLRNLPRWSAV